MTINLTIPTRATELKAKIMVIGIGGAGGNAINNMIKCELSGVDFIAMNTDAQALTQSKAPKTIQLGKNVTQGLGAGARPDLGKKAAQESMEEIVEQLQGCNMAFVAAGMGGGTGTGAAPIVAQIAKEKGILTVGVVTKPFNFEGTTRMGVADRGIEELHKYVDTLIVIPNQNLFRVCNEKTGFADAFQMADDVLQMGVRGVTDLITKPSLINLDFADIKSVMFGMGKAQLGTGEKTAEEGKNRAVEAAEAAISNPLLEDSSMKGAQSVLVNITGGPDMGLLEIDEAVNRIKEEIESNASIIFGAAIDKSMQGSIRVSIVATGMESERREQKSDPNIHNIRDFRKSAEMIPGQTSPTSQDPTASADFGITVSADEGEISSYPPTTDELSLPFSDSQQNVKDNTNSDMLEADEKKREGKANKTSRFFKRMFGFFRFSDHRTGNLKIEPSAIKTWPFIKGENPREELERSLTPAESDPETKLMDTDAIPQSPFTADLQTETPTVKATIQETLPEEKPEAEVKRADPMPSSPFTADLQTEMPTVKATIQETLPEEKSEAEVKKADPMPSSPTIAEKGNTRKASKTKNVIGNSQPMLEGMTDSSRNLSSDMDEELREIPAFLRRQAN